MRVATGRRWPGPEHDAVDLDALAAAINTARSTSDDGALYDELATQGWRRPSGKQPTREQIIANVDVVDPVTGCWLGLVASMAAATASGRA